MKVAMPLWDGMISPVLDSARKLCVFTVEDRSIKGNEEFILPDDVIQKITVILNRADVLICGALSCRMEQELVARGMKVHPWVMGDSEVIAAEFARGRIADFEYSMPGCRRGRRHGRCGNASERKTRQHQRSRR